MGEILIAEIVETLSMIARANNCELDRFEAQTDFISPEIVVTFRIRQVEDTKE